MIVFWAESLPVILMILICQPLVCNLSAMDEVCDSGIIIESDPETIFSRSSSKQDDLPLGDQTVAEVLQKAKEQIRWSLL